MSFRHPFRAIPVALTVAALAAAGYAMSASAAPPAPAKGDPAKAVAKYKVLCVACHKADGSGGFKSTGNPTPNWTLKKTWDATRTEAFMRDCIVNGKIKSGMVPWGKTGQLKPQEIEDMIAYVMTFKAKAK
jgi:mono/diheme cytochrome c family protein